MKRLFATFTIILLLVCVTTSFAQRNPGPTAACTEGVDYRISTDIIAWGNWVGEPISRSEHTFKFTAGADKTIQNIDVTIYVARSEATIVNPQPVFATGYLGQRTYVDPESGAHYYNYRWHLEAPQLFSTLTDMLTFDLFTNESTCGEIVAPVIISFQQQESQDFLNVCSGEYNYNPNLYEGAQNYLAPNADIGVLPTTETEPKVQVDHGYIGDQTISVPVYMRSLTFDYTDSAHVTVEWDPELDYIGFEPDHNFMEYGEANPIPGTDQVVLRIHDPVPEMYAQNLPAVNELFGTLKFGIANTATEGQALRVYIKGSAYFAGCPNMTDVDDVNNDTALVMVDQPDVTIGIGDCSMLTTSGTVNVPIWIKTNIPLERDLNTPTPLVSFANDLRALNNTAYQSIDLSYSWPVGQPTHTLYWTYDNVSPYKVFREDYYAQTTTNIEPSAQWQQIGVIKVNPTSVGVDTIFGIGSWAQTFVWKKYAGHDPEILHFDGTHMKVDSGILTVRAPSHGCPELYAHDGKDFRLEDFILTLSQSKPAPQDDYLPLQTSLGAIDGTYRLSIRESEQEVTYLDASELIVVDHMLGTSVGISTDGRIFGQGEALLPIEAFDNSGNDILPLVGVNDGNLFSSGEAGSMTVTYRNPHPGESGHVYVVVAAYGQKPPTPLGDALASETDDVYTEIEDAKGNWHSLGGIPPRDYTSLNSQCVFDSKTTELGETFRVRIVWQREYVIDCQQLQLDAGCDVAEYRLTPLEAVHSETGKISSTVSTRDENVVTITPGQSVELSFSVPPAFEKRGYERTFFFHSYGYYKRFVDGTLPNAFALGDNYPNPFNPSTTINLSVPVTGQVSLIVYNLLGQEVKTLFEGQLSAGTHDIIWNGDDNSGNKVASGVYLYRFSAPGFEKTKKMTLIK